VPVSPIKKMYKVLKEVIHERGETKIKGKEGATEISDYLRNNSKR